MTPFEEELNKTSKKIREYKKACEANIVSILWSVPEMYYTYDSLKLSNFTENVWKVYFQIGYDIIIKEKKKVLDDITVGLYLEKHSKLKQQYEKYKGYETIENAKAYVKTNNMDGYINELYKWNVVLDLLKRKFPISDRISNFVDMTSEQIYEEYEAILNHIFVNIDGEDITYDIADGLDELIEELDRGIAVGLPLYNSPILNKEIGGNLEGNITLVGGLSGAGKAQPLYSKVLTPNGFILMKDIKIGSKIIGDDGKEYNVTGVYPQGMKDVYEILFSDGSITHCCKEHLWKIQTPYNRAYNKYQIVELRDILDKPLYNVGKDGYKKYNYYIPMTSPVEFKEKKVFIDPYFLGVMIGDSNLNYTGSIKLSLYEDDVMEKINNILKKDNFELKLDKIDKKDYRIFDNNLNPRTFIKGELLHRLKIELENLELIGKKSYEKFIPKQYLFNTVENRIKLLQGLIDTDGEVKNQTYTYSTTSIQLAEDIQFLIQSLGGTCKISKRQTYYTHNDIKQKGRISYRLNIKTPKNILPFSSKKHKMNYKSCQTQARRTIRQIKLVGKEECQCIMVDSNSHLYLTDNFIVTHNTAISRTLILQSIIEHEEKIIIMINEEGKKKWQREFLVYVANNIFKEDLQKYIVRDGKYKKETKDLLKKCSDWIKQYKNTIILKPFKKYTTAKAIKTIKKYSSMGVKYFMLDTYKADAKTSSSEAFWFSMQQNMVEINDVIKPESKNVHIWITFQLSKGSSKQRFYDQDNIGMAKNIVDVASTCLMIRKVFDDELEGGKRELNVYRKEKRQGNIESQIPVKLKKGKNYQIIFIVKNREGSTNEYQIVIDHDLSRNTYKEIGYTVVPVDF